MTSRQHSSRLTASTTAPVRRNLFHHLGRRPTSASTSTSATTLFDAPQESSSSDIIVRNQNGDYEICIPSLPAADDKEEPDAEGPDNEQDFDARLLEMYRNRTRQSAEPLELLAAVQASLRRKVASLEADNWMFEAEKTTPG